MNKKCKSMKEVVGYVTEVDKNFGCLECKNRYFLKDKECHKCDDNCKTCMTKENSCTTCNDDHVNVDNICIKYTLIDKCKKAKDSKCFKYSFWHKPSPNGSQCNSHVEVWLVVLIVLFGVIILLAVTTVLTYFLVKEIIVTKKRRELQKTTCIFKMNRSNITFHSIGKGIQTNFKEIHFNEDQQLKVEEEYRELVCIGNRNRRAMKIQLTVKEGVVKYSIRTQPEIIAVRQGEACEFELFLTIHCTCKLNDEIMVISKPTRNSNEELLCSLKIIAESEISMRIDPDELEEEKKIGEGSFGVVYLGNFRGNKVAIKRLKEVDGKSDEEFTKEVKMLDKIRNDYIVHFYGASFIPTYVCMVTEYAPYGSLNDF